MTEYVMVAIEFLDNERRLAREIYPLSAFPDGWPLPEKINAFPIGGRIAVATLEATPDDMKQYVTRFQKITESKLTDEDLTVVPGLLMRGAIYKLDE